MGSLCLPSMSTSPLSEAQDTLVQIIEALPLNDHFVLVENMSGLMSGLLWPLHPRLMGVAMLNVHAVFSDEYLASDTWKLHAPRIQNLITLYEGEHVEKIQTITLNVGVHGGFDSQELARVGQRYREALETAGPAFWTYSSSRLRWFAQQAEVLRGLPPLDPLPVALVICGDNAAAGMVLESSRRFRDLCLPCAELCYIEDSKCWWEAEGADQHESVRKLLDSLLCRVEALM